MTGSAWGRQRPLLTENPRTTDDRTVISELGFGYQHRARFPLSGLTGDLYSVLDGRLRFGLGDRVEFQLGGVAQHYLKPENGSGSRNDWGDGVVSTKIRVISEKGARPIVSFQPTVVVPNSNDTKGIGTDTTDFYASVLLGKTVGRAFVFGNLGLGILDDATRVSEQHDVMVYGIAAMVPLTDQVNLAAEWNGRRNAVTNPTPGGESRGQVRAGFQILLWNTGWLDFAVTAGTTDIDHKAGFVLGMSKEFRFGR
jgi:hypothetical protein